MTASLYLIGSCAAGRDDAKSDVDLIVVAPEGMPADAELGALRVAGRIDEIRAGRPADAVIIGLEYLSSNHLHRQHLHHAKLLAGPGVDIPPVDPRIWAEQAQRWAEELLNKPEYQGQRRTSYADAVLWAAGSRIVKLGEPAPACREDVVEACHRVVGGRWSIVMEAWNGFPITDWAIREFVHPDGVRT